MSKAYLVEGSLPDAADARRQSFSGRLNLLADEAGFQVLAALLCASPSWSWPVDGRQRG